MNPRLPLRITVPVAVLAVALGATAVSLGIGLHLVRRDVLARAERASRARLSREEFILEAGLRRGDASFVEEVVAGLRSDRAVRHAVLIDGNDRVVASTRRRELGRSLADLPEVATAVAAARQRSGPTLLPAEGGGRLRGAIALEPASEGGHEPTWALMVEHDAGRAMQRTGADVLAGAAVFAAIVVLATLIVAWWFRRSVSQRATAVAAAADRIALGDLETRTGVQGGDELGTIAAAVDAMATRLQEHRRANQQSEQRYRAVFEQTDESIFITTAEGRYVDVNPAALALLGYRRDELVGQPLMNLVPPEERAARPPRLEELKAHGALVSNRRLLAKSGERIPIEMRTRVLSDGRILALVVDLRPRFEAEKLQQKLDLHQRLASLGTLAASVGHELNNPLTYVLGNLEEAVALSKELPPATRERLEPCLADAAEGAGRLKRIVADLRIFTRAPGDDVMGPVALTAVARTALSLSAGVRDRARVALQMPEPGLRVRAEAQRLTQVLVNLLANAAYAMPTGRPISDNEIVVRARAEAQQVVLEVADNGAGIPAPVLPRIFEPFFTTKPLGEGSGLGLAISRELLGRAGASIEVDSTEGQGTTLRIRLQAEGPTAAEAGSAQPPVTAAGAAQRLRVLVVDDEALVRGLLTRWLDGHDAMSAAGPAEALALCQDHDFDRIFCDLSMPGGGGQAFLAVLRERRPELVDRLVFMTGGAMSDQAQAFLDGTDLPVLDKPIRQQDFLAALTGPGRPT